MEYFSANGSAPRPSNLGVWVVDGARGAYVHGEGQANNFCACANRTGAAAGAECRLVFSAPAAPAPDAAARALQQPRRTLALARPQAAAGEGRAATAREGGAGGGGDGWMRVYFPSDGFCCKLCNASTGCGVLRNDWLALAGATYTGESDVRGRRCERWSAQGAVALDEWLGVEGDPAVPCEYHERFTFPGGTVDHSLVFDVDSYQPGVAAEDVMTPPRDCERRCPLIFGDTC